MCKFDYFRDASYVLIRIVIRALYVKIDLNPNTFIILGWFQHPYEWLSLEWDRRELKTIYLIYLLYLSC